jgi:hypothetical protein
MRSKTHARCVGHNRDGSPCGSWALTGTSVCRMHGGAAPQVKRKAEERIRELVNPALALIAEILETGRAEDLPASVSLTAARDILDRAGFGATHRLDARIEGDIHVREISELDRRIEGLLGRMEELDTAGEGPLGLAARGEAEPADPAR